MRILRSAARAQLLFLRILNVLAPGASRVRLFVPGAEVYCRDEFPLVSYREVFVEQCYEPPVALPERPRIIDIGGHLGMASLYFARRFEGARIDVYEANPEASALLHKTFAEEHAADITIHDCAIGPNAGTARLFVAAGPRVPTDASLLQHSPDTRPTIEVPVRDIRLAAAGHVDLLKLDIEGMEYDCLDALAPTPERLPCLVVEFHDCLRRADRLNRSLAQLREAGYRLLNAQKREIQPSELHGHEAMVIWAVGRAG